MSTDLSQDLHFARVEALGRSFTFLLNSRSDYVQQFISRGRFYEAEELEIICEHAAGCKRLLDVGANIGTHSIYLAHRLNLERVVPIECQAFILPILKANLGLNWHPSFDLRHLGVGLSSRTAAGRMASFAPLNFGGTQFREAAEDEPFTEGLSVPLVAADDLFSPGEFDLIKMDIEGMELLALQGMRRLLESFKGLLFVEIVDANAAAFQEFLATSTLRPLGTMRRYKGCENWLLRGE